MENIQKDQYICHYKKSLTEMELIQGKNLGHQSSAALLRVLLRSHNSKILGRQCCCCDPSLAYLRFLH